IGGEMQGTLNASLAQRQDVTTWIRQAVNNALEGMISFNTDARNGDRYRILVEEEFSEGRRIPGGRVLYASYEGKVAGHREAFWYEESDPRSAYNAHYTVEGKALASSGMRLPVDRIHVTSTFGYRIHPITGRRGMHNGVDYGGRVGDPVYAVASGTVVTAAQDPYSGKKIFLRHIDGTETCYLHLSAIGVRQGAPVKGGQLIGRVGNTGRSTGAHLHFGIRQKGQWVNPLRIKMIAAPTLTGERFDRFKGQMRDIRALLEKTAASG
ncbi:MAG TPA: M23 family metallopeptidase, partial [bacterium]|nr:M23 family metallopeptidase [bacterium]